MNFYQYKKFTSLLIIFTLFIGFFTPIASTSVQATNAITVADAIELNKDGSVQTVEGYIVAHTSGSQSLDFEAPYGNDYNLAIADSSGETDKNKIMSVQLPSSFRAEFGLKTNPDNIGTKIQVTGNLIEYFNLHGIKETTNVVTVDGSGTPAPDPIPTLISIADARNTANGKTVIVEGVVTADNSAIGGGKLSTYIQDDTAGINVYSSTAQDLIEGQKVRITGSLAEYKGLKEIVPTNVETLNTNEPLPTPKSITLADLQTATIAEPLEGQLVKVTGYVQSIPSSPAGGGYNVSFIDVDFNSTTLRVLEGTNALAALEEGKWYEVTAIVSQYDSYQLIPRKAEDFQLLGVQPEAPSAAGEYPSVVANVVDGDTIHLSTPVLGSTKVRFLNIDTPETYHAPKDSEGLDQNQLDKGLEAKAYINTLLAAGDEVTIKIGQEPMDAYGRLLAQVIRKDNNLNVNLEMVRQGMAVTYFIWPVGDETDYNTFQAAVKAASDEELGIWNPSDPLLELPFEFRAREQGKGLSRYVGNSETKMFVTPDLWETVPVEKRIFFASAEEASEQGYSPESGTTTPPPVEEDPNGSTDNISLQLLSLNDLHGKIDQEYELDTNGDGVNETVGRMDYVAAYLKDREATNPNTLIVHAGDMIGGSSPVSALLQDEPTIEILEAIGFDFGTVGNHEFDEGTAELLRMVNGGEHPQGKGTENYDGMSFYNLCANCISKATNEPILPPHAVYEVEGVKVGFIGVNTTSTATMVIPSGIQDITFTDEVAAVNKSVTELKAQGVNAIIVLAHMPASQSGTSATGDSADLANAVNDEVDVIFAAHNHEIVNAIVDNKLIVQALDYGKAFADVDLELDPTTKDIVKKQAEIVYVVQEGVTPDPTVAGILTKYETQVADIMNQVIGFAAVELKGGYGVKGEIGDNALGNLIADSMLTAMGTDFALMNGGGIRDNINAGDITWSELFNVQPFGNILVSVEITGADLEQIVNAQISAQYGPDVSVGGFKYTWDGSTNKVINLFLPNGTKIDKTATYTVTVNNYMYEHGSDKYKLQALGENAIYGVTDLEGLVSFVESFEGPINYVAEGRISEVVPEPGDNLGLVTLKAARQAELGTIVEVEGVVTSTPGAWGSKGFYLQDTTSGAYVFTSTDSGVKVGDRIRVSGKTAEYNGEFQLSDVTIELLGDGTVPSPLAVTPAQISADNEGQLVVLEGATITELKAVGTYGTFEFIATKGNESVLVRVDNRTGLKFSDFAFADGNLVDITGISGQHNGKIQLKPRMSADIIAATVSEPVELTVNGATLTIGGKAVSAYKNAENNYSVPLYGFADSEYFTDIELEVSGDASYATFTFYGVTKRVEFTNGRLITSVADVLGTLDPQQDGVTVAKLRELLNENGASLTATVYAADGQSTNVSIAIIDEIPAPVNIKTSAVNSSEVKLTWDSVYNASSYKVYRSKEENGNFEWIGTVPGTTYQDTGLEVATKYFYKVSTVVNGEESSQSSSIEATTQIDECFIATAAYGSKFTPAVTLLRQFRDEFLLTNALGSKFVEFYYTHSPKIAKVIAENEFLKAGVRIALTPVTAVAYMMFHPTLLFALAMVGFGMLYTRKRKQLLSI